MTTEEILELLQDVAARVIAPRFRSLSSGDIDEKKPGDYVTIADRESEEEIAAALRSAYPDALIVGEEASFTDPGLMGAIPDAPHAFVIDPIDGTRNFVHGSPDHAVMLGELRAGKVVRGWIWQPEHGLAFVAESGAGVTRNGEQLAPVERTDLPRIESSSLRDLGQLTQRSDWPIGHTRFCCGVDYPRLITGEVEGLVYRSPKPWDHAAGTLMMTELDATPRLLDGSDYRPGPPRGVLLAASSEDAWQELATAIGVVGR